MAAKSTTNCPHARLCKLLKIPSELRRRNPKSETRNPKEIRSPRLEPDLSEVLLLDNFMRNR